MKKPNTISNETEALSDNVHCNAQWLVTAKNKKIIFRGLGRGGF